MKKDKTDERAAEINSLCDEIYYANADKGFWDEREIIPALMKCAVNNSGKKVFSPSEVLFARKAITAQAIALMHSELSEALEADRKDLMDDKLPHRSGLEVELADTVIRIFDFAGGMELDLGGAIFEKLEYNRSRPHKHGKKY